ncbi:MAG: hypothetical protein LUG98_02700 [Tannerellaceae bacterium]|nr:hypothetical protein [Tannerellaceae bacterium]
MKTDNRMIKKPAGGLPPEQKKSTLFPPRFCPIIYLLFILHVAFLVSSCSEDDFTTAGSLSEDRSRVVLTMNLPARGLADDDSQDPEKQISDVLVMAFDNSDDTFLYMEEASEMVETAGGLKITVQLRKGLQDLYILAGAKTDVLTLFPSGIPGDGTETKTTLQQKLSVSRSGVWDATVPIPMWGSCTVTIDRDHTDLSGSPVPLVRMLAKITVSKDVAIPDTDFTLTKIHLCNYQEKGFLIPQAGAWNGTMVTAPTVNSSVVTTPYLAFPASEVLYTFEAEAGTRTGYVKNTLLVAEGYYKGSTSKSFYRIDFIKEGESAYSPLLRNHHYRVTLKEITGPGQPSVEEAIKALPVDLKAGIVVWDEGYTNQEDLGKQDLFTLSQSLFVYPGWVDGRGTVSTGSIEVSSTTEWTYAVSTSASVIEGDAGSWFMATRSQDNVHFTLKENPGEKREVFIHFKTNNLTRVATIRQRKGAYPNSYILPINGTLHLPVRKAYLVWADDVMGDQKQTLIGNVTYELIWQDEPGLVSVDYAPGSNAATGDKTVLLVTAHKGIPGNALIGVKVNNIRRYSWHIWITDYDPDTQTGGSTLLYNNGYQDYRFMDRNLGATTTTVAKLTTHGFLYQWGRKDPFPGAPVIVIHNEVNQSAPGSSHKFLYNASDELITIPIIESPVTHPNINSNNLYYSLQHPDYFLGVLNNESADWYNDHKEYLNDYLWNDLNGQKGVFDPCPDGWRVPDWTRDAEGIPKYSPWRNWTDSNCQVDLWGRSFDGYYFPECGYRNGTYFSGVGRDGVYWTSSTVPESLSIWWSKAYVLNITVGGAHPITTFNRCLGASVRCVQE